MRKLNLRPISEWLRTKLLRKRVGLLVIGIGVPWLWLLWQFFGPLSAFPVSAETTIFTEPLTPRGYVDYIKIFQDRYQHPDAKPVREDRWCLLAGTLENTPEEPRGLPKFPGISSLLESAKADHPDREVAVMRSLSMNGLPIAAVHDFKISANGSAAAKKFLDDNEPWYAAVKNSEPTPPLFETYRTSGARDAAKEYGLCDVLLERSQRYGNQIAERFLFRAAMHFEAGHFAEGLEDIHIVYKAARNCDANFVIGYSFALRTRRQANEELINGLVLCPSIDERVAHQLTQMPVTLQAEEDVVRILDEKQRFAALDSVQSIHRSPAESFWNSVRVPNRFSGMAKRYAAHRLDFSRLLRFQNRLIDQACVAMRKPTYREQVASINALHAQMASKANPATPDLSFFSHDFQSAAEQFLVSIQFLRTLPRDIAAQITSRRVLHLAARLARWKTINGHYPDSLEVLNTIPGLPPMPEGVLIDAFSNEPLRYERVGDRYRIRSAGEDMQFNDRLANDSSWPSQELLRPE